MRISDWSSDVCSSDLDHILLEADQRVLLALDRRLGEDAGGLLERRRRDEAARLQRRLGDAEQDGLALRRVLLLFEPGVDRVHLLAIDLFARQQRGVAAVGDLDLLQHLANDHLDEIGRAHVELQSLMRNSYAVFWLKK